MVCCTGATWPCRPTFANWRQYTKIIVDPVTFWGGDTTKVSTAERQALTDHFFQVLRQRLGQKFQLVDEPGPGVMRLQVALTDAEAATPGLRTISTIVPQARALNTLKFAATGTYAFIGGRRPRRSSRTPSPGSSWRKGWTGVWAADRSRTRRSGNGATPRT
jgi:hypothetical protein